MPGAFKRKRWREQHRVRIDLNGMMAHLIGDTGVSENDIEALVPRLADVHAAFETQRRAGALAFTELPYAAKELKRTLALAREVRGHFDELVVIGAGDSALGARALTSALEPAQENDMPAPGGMRVHVADSIDPTWLGPLLDRLEPRRTLFNVISRSGDAPGTMAAFMIVRDRLLRELGAVEYKRHVVVTTRAGEGALRQIVNDEGFRDLPVPAQVAGPFSILSAAGLFPAAAAGADVAEMLAGAADMDSRCRVADARANPALLLAGMSYLVMTRGGRRDLVLEPYTRALAAMATWFLRVWTESVGHVPAPQDAAGNVVVFIRVEEHARALGVPKSYEDMEAVAYLGGHDLGALLNLQQQAAEIALSKAGRPSVTLVCPRLNPFVVGALAYLLETVGAMVGSLYGSEAPPAGRENASQLAYGLAGRSGDEGDRAEAQRWLARKEARYVI